MSSKTGIFALAMRACKSSVTCTMVRGAETGSLVPIPARSYEQTRANLATSGCTLFQTEEGLPNPDSSMTVGVPAVFNPEHVMCNLRPPPTSTNLSNKGEARASSLTF